MRNIVGFDLGTNSIGTALIQCQDDNDLTKKIIAAGCRIIPMDEGSLGKFDKGCTVSQTKDRTESRSIRRLCERHLLRRERLLRVLDIMDFLPEHISSALTRYGKYKDPSEEPKIAWRKDKDGKYKFIYTSSFNEMLADFRKYQPELVAKGMKVPYDWTIYYLRKKALSKPLTPHELAWILLNFNQKRGYYQLRDNEGTLSADKKEEYLALRIINVIDTGEKKKEKKKFDIVLENGLRYTMSADKAPDWIGKVKEFILTTQLDKNGKPQKDESGKTKASLRMPKEEDWKLLMKKTEKDIENSGMTVGEYIYDTLLHNPKQKINGKLVHVIERNYYRKELEMILKNQTRFITKLSDMELYNKCITELYPSNESYRESIASRGFMYLFMDDIIFYQRQLRKNKSEIADCPYEILQYTKNGESHTAHVKCIAKSHPLFQEFRLWQFVKNLHIIQRKNVVGESRVFDIDVTDQYLHGEDDYVRLFEFLNSRTNIKQDTLLKKVIEMHSSDYNVQDFRWNYVEDKTYPCNETVGNIIKYLKKAGCNTTLANDTSFVEHLWHILYSVEDKKELRTALTHFSARYNLNEQFVDIFADMPPYEKDYGAYSAKAIKKLLPLMRMGKYWNEANIDNATKDRINKIINGECDESISKRVREKSIHLTSIEQFRALPLWLACYVVYNRHSESADASRWTSPDNIDTYLKNFKQHSLRNPVVENVVLETLRVTRDLWRKYGHIDEIHIELGREMKNPANVRKAISKRNIKNEEANLRAKRLLAELTNPKYETKNVHPFSPKQQEKMRIYEDWVLNNGTKVNKDILQIVEKFTTSEDEETENGETKKKKSEKKQALTEAEIERYIHWLEQQYVSPYTGQVIPLKKLFTTAYEIDHIIPQSRYFDDSFSNKVICETEVNKLKDNKLGYEFIMQHNGEIVQLSDGRNVSILSPQQYAENIELQYKGNRTKMQKLLMEDIPDDFIRRQLNDSRYISSFIKSLLSNIVREEGEMEATSKNVIVVSGAITDRLKKDWGMDDVWNRIVLPRFKRLNELTGTNEFTAINTNGHEIPSMPIELLKGFNKKRIDHRHHAMDAIVIACTTREHVNLLNNEAALSKNKDYRHKLSQKLRRYEQKEIERNGVRKRMKTAKEFKKPWTSFTADVEKMLNKIVVSFKQNLRVINKTTNYYQHFENGKKTIAVQRKGDSWAIRKPMHEATIYGEINIRRTKYVKLKEAIKHPSDIKDKILRRKICELIDTQYDLKKIQCYFKENSDKWSNINLEKIEIYYFTSETKDRFFATRKPIDKSFTESKIKKSIADSAIQKILTQHLKMHGNNADAAFSPDGIDEMNRNIVALNNGHPHQPIYKVRIHEKADKKFAIGEQGNKAKMFVEAAGGTNLFFAIYETVTIDSKTGETKKKRSYATVPLNVAIDRLKQGLPPTTNNADGIAPKYVLSPNDLVYVPTQEELKRKRITKISDFSRIYRFVNSDGTTANFVPHSVAKVILSMKKEDAEKLCKGETLIQNEFGIGSPQSKNQKAVTKEMIKEICIPIKVTRLGDYSF